MSWWDICQCTCKQCRFQNVQRKISFSNDYDEGNAFKTTVRPTNDTNFQYWIFTRQRILKKSSEQTDCRLSVPHTAAHLCLLSLLLREGNCPIFYSTHEIVSVPSFIKNWQHSIISKKGSSTNQICRFSTLIQALEVVTLYSWHMQAGENFSGYPTQTVFASISWRLSEPVWRTRWSGFIALGWS